MVEDDDERVSLDERAGVVIAPRMDERGACSDAWCWPLIRRVVHDLRSPINVAEFGIRLLELHARSQRDPDLDDTLARTRGGVNAVGRMLDQLAVLAKFQMGRPRLELAPVELAALINKLADELTAAGDVAIERDMPARLVAKLDDVWFRQVIWSLLRNATAHGEGGVRVRASREDARLRLAVANRGDIPPELREDLFRPPPLRAGEHLGVGLYVASEIVAAHGGTIELETGRGRTVATVRVPQGPDLSGSSPSPGPGS